MSSTTTNTASRRVQKILIFALILCACLLITTRYETIVGNTGTLLSKGYTHISQNGASVLKNNIPKGVTNGYNAGGKPSKAELNVTTKATKASASRTITTKASARSTITTNASASSTITTKASASSTISTSTTTSASTTHKATSGTTRMLPDLESILKERGLITTRPPPPTPLSFNGQKSKYQVPNIVHYIWYTKTPKDLQFYHLLGMLSAHQVQKPDKIFVHVDVEPTGKYWKEAKDKIPNLIVMHRPIETNVFGQELDMSGYNTNPSDVLRVKLMQEVGGIYLDFDVYLINSLDPLRVYPSTVGYEYPGRVCGGFIMSVHHSPFMFLWLHAMIDDFRKQTWAYISGVIPSKLISRYGGTGIIHIEPELIHHPNWQQLQFIIGPEHYDWSKNYAIHLWHRLWERNGNWKEWKFEPSPETIKKLENTFGQVARKIYYGSADIIK